MAVTDIQNALLGMADIISQSSVESLRLDKTVKATVQRCSNALTKEYMVSYNGNVMRAFAEGDASYTTNSLVYVLIPQGDLSERKTIVGRVDTQDENNFMFISSVTENYNPIGNNPVADLAVTGGYALSSYEVTSSKILYAHNEDEEHPNVLSVNDEVLARYLKDADALRISAEFCTDLPYEHRVAENGTYGLYVTLAFKNEGEEGGYVYRTYELDVDDFIGNPMSFSTFTPQYQMFGIDGGSNFSYVDKIEIKSSGFVSEDTTDPPANIWVRNVSILAQKEIGDTADGYKVTLEYPNGAAFTGTIDGPLSVNGRFKQNGVTDLTDDATWYWFRKDSTVGSNSPYYNIVGGVGWRYLKDQVGNIATLTKDDNKASENLYKVVADYKNTVRLKQEFVVYNTTVEYELTITSSLGQQFAFDSGETTLKATIGGNSVKKDEDQGKDYPYSFYWTVTDANGTVRKFEPSPADEEDPKKEIDNLRKQNIEITNRILEIRADDENYPTEDLKKNAINPLAEKKVKNLKSITAEQAKIRDIASSNYTLMSSSNKRENDTVLYQIRGMESPITVSCTAIKIEGEDVSYEVARGSITLFNDRTSVSGYRVYIENGTQVFKYNESGISPAHERYGPDAQKVLPLSVRFFGPGDNEIATDFTVRWEFPTRSTMIKDGTDKNKGTYNESGHLLVDICEFTITDVYKASAEDNQITAIVSFMGREFRQDTDFLFVKVGEAGTNGTDVVCRIGLQIVEPSDENPDPELSAGIPYIYKSSDDYYYWHYPEREQGQNVRIDENKGRPLVLRAYDKTTRITQVSPSWFIPTISNKIKNKTGGYTVSGGKVSVKSDGSNSGEMVCIVGASAVVSEKTVYSYLPIPRVEYTGAVDRGNFILFDEERCLQYVTYNSDGKNPMYKGNSGVAIILPDIPSDKNPSWSISADSVTLNRDDGSLTYSKSDPQNALSSTDTYIDENKEEQEYGYSLQPFIHLVPGDNYNGQHADNGVSFTLTYSWYENEGETPVTRTANIFYPVCMTLNRYELESLNGWNGNNVVVKDDNKAGDGYILAPQVGAGVKNGDNSFTGIIMGKRITYDGNSNEIQDVGLFGYSNGKQSIFLDAEDGSAHFGLPETEDDAINGRIEFYPYTNVANANSENKSHIGNWYIGRNSLYNVKASIYEKQQDNTIKKSNISIYQGNKLIPFGGKFGTNAYSLYGDKTMSDNTSYSDFYPKADDTEVQLLSVQGNSRGIILNANPAFLSMKSRPFGVDKNGKLSTSVDSKIIRWKSSNVAIKPGDSFEVEIDPNKPSVFTIYRHTFLIDGKTEGEQTLDMRNDFFPNALNMFYAGKAGGGVPPSVEGKTGVGHWYRQPFVGINTNGEFYTNAVENNGTSMGVGALGAFGSDKSNNEYIGGKFALNQGSVNIAKIFMENVENDDEDARKQRTLYISGGTDSANEYPRPISLHGKSISAYVPTKSSEHKTKTTSTYFSLGGEEGGDDQGFVVYRMYDSANESSLRIRKNIGIETKSGVLAISSYGNASITSTNGNASMASTNGNMSLYGRNRLTADTKLSNNNDETNTYLRMNLKDTSNKDRTWLMLSNREISAGIAQESDTDEAKFQGISIVGARHSNTSRTSQIASSRPLDIKGYCTSGSGNTLKYGVSVIGKQKVYITSKYADGNFSDPGTEHTTPGNSSLALESPLNGSSTFYLTSKSGRVESKFLNETDSSKNYPKDVAANGNFVMGSKHIVNIQSAMMSGSGYFTGEEEAANNKYALYSDRGLCVRNGSTKIVGSDVTVMKYDNAGGNLNINGGGISVSKDSDGNGGDIHLYGKDNDDNTMGYVYAGNFVIGSNTNIRDNWAVKKSELDAAIAGIPATDLSNYYTKADVYSKTEINDSGAYNMNVEFPIGGGSYRTVANALSWIYYRLQNMT